MRKGPTASEPLSFGEAISLLLARPLKGPCLVVCPMAAVQQWVKEIALGPHEDRRDTGGAVLWVMIAACKLRPSLPRKAGSFCGAES